jgi:multiple sugar transport system substrate-binding protein
METERLEIQREIAQILTAKTGIHVRVVPVNKNRLAKQVTAANATEALPDVLYHPIDFTAGWAQAGLLDVRSATDVVNRLGKETFCSASLNLVRSSDGYAAVPIDGWQQLLLYRKDLFKKKGLPVPDSRDRILIFRFLNGLRHAFPGRAWECMQSMGKSKPIIY